MQNWFKEINRVLDYIHHNPVSGKWRLAEDFTKYPHSSAGFYECGKIGEVMIRERSTQSPLPRPKARVTLREEKQFDLCEKFDMCIYL